MTLWDNTRQRWEFEFSTAPSETVQAQQNGAEWRWNRLTGMFHSTYLKDVLDKGKVFQESCSHEIVDD